MKNVEDVVAQATDNANQAYQDVSNSRTRIEKIKDDIANIQKLSPAQIKNLLEEVSKHNVFCFHSYIQQTMNSLWAACNAKIT